MQTKKDYIFLAAMKLSSRQYWFISVVLLVVGLGWIWASAAPSGTTTGGLIPAPQQGFLAPDLQLPQQSGDPISLADFGGRPVVINFWASWCPPCRAEMPALQRVYDDYQHRGLVILGINTTNQDTMAAAREFISEYGLTFPIAFDLGGRVSNDYRLRSLPTTFFIDRKGIIREVVVGGPLSEALLRIRVENLLKERD